MPTIKCPCGTEHAGRRGRLCGPCQDLEAFRRTGEVEHDPSVPDTREELAFEKTDRAIAQLGRG